MSEPLPDLPPRATPAGSGPALPPVLDLPPPDSALLDNPPPEPRVTVSRRPRLSLVWLVPLLALGIGASLMVHSILQTGPRIAIEFPTAEGLEAGKTELRYKEVVIGKVLAVTLRADRQRVVVTAQLDRAAAGLAVEDTRFWVVRPRIGAAGISGLGTLLSGAYIGADAGQSNESQANFVGLEAAPYVLRGEPGAGFVLRASDLGSLDIGSPLYYRRTRVGRVVGYTLDPQTDELLVKIFVEAPYQTLVTSQARFWNASGVDLSIDANGLTLNTQTVATVLAGGVAFEAAMDQARGEPAPAGSVFTLFDHRKAAMAPPLGNALPVRFVFDGSLRGLGTDAPIEFLGVEIGKVRGVSLQYDKARARFPVQVLADLYPLRLGAVRGALAQRGSAQASAAGDMALLQHLVDRGLRAQLRTGNLLTGQLYIAMDFQPRSAPAKLALREGVLTLPTVPGALSALQTQVSEIVSKLSKLPLEDIGRGLAGTLQQAGTSLRELTPEARALLAEGQRTLQAAQSLVQQLGPEAQQSLAELRRTIAGAQTALERIDQNLIDPAAPVQRNLEATLLELQRAAQALRGLADTLQRHPESLLRGMPADPLQSPGR